MARFSDHQYAAMGEQAIIELLAQEHAAVWPEIEAKIADLAWQSLPLPIQPHHLTTARHRLIKAGHIIQVSSATRGGRQVSVITPADVRRRKRAIEDASARKRLLQTRFLTWASGTASVGSGVIGRAGEQVVHAGLSAAAAYGYRLFSPETGQVHSLFGHPVASGPLDNGALLTTVDARTQIPTGQYVTLIEIKNVRSWIYPSAAELHQLLDKVAELQMTFADQAFLPVLVCRRAHFTTAAMAEHLGFYVISTKAQYVPVSLAATAELSEVVAELGYDLVPSPEQPPPALVKHFTTTLQAVAARTAERWRLSAEDLGERFKTLRDTKTRYDKRQRELQDLRVAAVAVHGPPHRAW